MDRELIKDYFQKSDFTAVQADALAKILAEMATKKDLAQLKEELTWRFIAAAAFLAAVMTLLDVFVD